MDHQGRPSRADPRPYRRAELLRAAEAVRCGQHRRGLRRRARRGLCGDEPKGWRGRHGSASAGGSRGSSHGGGCSAGRCACSRGLSKNVGRCVPDYAGDHGSCTSVAPGLASCSPHNQGHARRRCAGTPRKPRTAVQRYVTVPPRVKPGARSARHSWFPHLGTTGRTTGAVCPHTLWESTSMLVGRVVTDPRSPLPSQRLRIVHLASTVV